LLRLGRALVEQYCGSFRAVPKRIVLDIDDTFDRVHGGQQLRLFNAFYDDYGFQPIVVFDGEGRFVTALLRPGKRPSGVEIRAFLRLVGAIRAYWPRVEILLRADSHYAAPEVFEWCRANRVDWIFGLAGNVALSRHVVALEQSTAARFNAAPTRGKVRRFTQFYDAAQSWRRVERIIARVEAGAEGIDTRYIVTNLEAGRTKHLYERLYCARGQADNHIKAWKNHLAADRTSCHTAEANQFRLFLHAGAYWLLWSMRRVMPKTLSLAGRAVRHLAAAPHQARRPRRRAENPAQDPPPVKRPRSGDLRHAPRPLAAPRHLIDGAYAPEFARLRSTSSAYPITTDKPATAGLHRLVCTLQITTDPRVTGRH
jgi:hypothetical protein